MSPMSRGALREGEEEEGVDARASASLLGLSTVVYGWWSHGHALRLTVTR